ncbi:hypothetical protein K439DRAFT_1262534, partial [Ramaria rubella]
NKYNAMAPLQDPSCQLLEYSAVVAYSWLGEFDLLKESRYEVLQRPWAIPLYREIASKYYKLVCAHEELVHLNVEIQHLHTWVNDKDIYLTHSADFEPPIAMAIRAQHGQRWHVNNVHQTCLQTIYRLSGYSG